MSLVDVHTHVVPATLPAPPDPSLHLWPVLVDGKEPGRRLLQVGGQTMRQLDARSWDAGTRLRAMDTADVAVQALSPMPELLAYWFEPAHSVRLTDHVNAMIANLVAQAPDRFVGLGAVTLPDPPRALAQLEELRESGFRGIEIATHVNGAPLSSERFAPVFAAAEEMGMAVMVHAARPRCTWEGVNFPGMDTLVGYPLDTAVCVVDLLRAGFPSRYPRLRLAFCHCGGAAAVVLARIRHATKSVPDVAQTFGTDVLAAAAYFYYDSLACDDELLACAVKLFGSDRIVIGTDFPFPIQDPNPAERIGRLALPEQDRDRILRGNACEFLGIETVQIPPATRLYNKKSEDQP